MTTILYGRWSVWTVGKGLYTKKAGEIVITAFEIDYDDDGRPYSMLAFFDLTTWDVKKDGYPYTDRTLESQVQGIFEALGIPIVPTWSERGRQATNAMDFDLGTPKEIAVSRAIFANPRYAQMQIPPIQDDFVKGTWVVLTNGAMGELDKFFVPERDQETMHQILSDRLRNDWTVIRAGDKIEFVEGESEIG